MSIKALRAEKDSPKRSAFDEAEALRRARSYRSTENIFAVFSPDTA
jgi:hypothetical protein